MCVHVCIYIYMYFYIERERERALRAYMCNLGRLRVSSRIRHLYTCIMYGMNVPTYHKMRVQPSLSPMGFLRGTHAPISIRTKGAT